MPNILIRNISDEIHRLIHKAAQEDFFKKKEKGKTEKGQKVSIVRWIIEACEQRLKRDGYL